MSDTWTPPGPTPAETGPAGAPAPPVAAAADHTPQPAPLPPYAGPPAAPHVPRHLAQQAPPPAGAPGPYGGAPAWQGPPAWQGAPGPQGPAFPGDVVPQPTWRPSRYAPTSRSGDGTGRAVAALVLALLPLFVTNVVGVVLGVVGILHGRGRAVGVSVTAVVAGLLVLSTLTVATVAAVTGEEDEADLADDPFAELSGTGAYVDELRTGDCYLDPSTRGNDGELVWVDRVELVDCDEPHEAEVVGIHTLTSEPDDSDDFHDDAYVACDDLFFEYATTDHYEDLGNWVEYYWPSEQSWRRGDDALTCAVRWEEPRTGSIAD